MALHIPNNLIFIIITKTISKYKIDKQRITKGKKRAQNWKEKITKSARQTGSQITAYSDVSLPQLDL